VVFFVHRLCVNTLHTERAYLASTPVVWLLLCACVPALLFWIDVGVLFSTNTHVFVGLGPNNERNWWGKPPTLNRLRTVPGSKSHSVSNFCVVEQDVLILEEAGTADPSMRSFFGVYVYPISNTLCVA
jgi:hypothetical protein